MMDECISCFKLLSRDNVNLKCSVCEHRYHVGKCSGVTKSALKNMTTETFEFWVCSTCKVHEDRQSGVSGNENSVMPPLLGEPEPVGVAAEIAEMNKKLTSVLEKVTKLETTLEKYDELLKRSEHQEKEIAELTAKTTQLEVIISEQTCEITNLKVVINKTEQYSRRKNIEIHGVKQSENENVLDLVKSLSEKLELPPITEHSVEAVHRLRTREGRVAPILVRFTERNTRDLWIKKRVALKRDGVYVNENLTATTKNLLWVTKNKARDKEYKFIWVKNGQIFVRQKEGAAVIRIESEADLNKLK